MRAKYIEEDYYKDMNILITINKGYVNQLNVLLNSIEDSNYNETFDIYILHKNLSVNDFKIIKHGLNFKKMHIHGIKIKKSEVDSFPVYEKRYPVEIYFRIFATRYLPEKLDRILYLDADTVVINPLKELYDMDFEDNYFIAATHIKKILHKFNEIRLDLKKNEPYINSGVLLINLEKLRNLKLEEKVFNYVEKNKNKLMLPDQDIISSIFGSKIKLMDSLKYNLGDKGVRLHNLENPLNRIDLRWIRKNTVVIHYYGRNKPWNKNYKGILGIFYKKAQSKIKRKVFKGKKVLILSCGTGGGHNTAAKAVRENLTSKNIQADFYEYLDIVNPKLNTTVNDLYIKSTKGKGKVFKNAYKLGEIYEKTKIISPVYLLNSLTKKTLYDFIKTEKYDYVVTTHLFPGQALTEINQKHKVKFMEIATDYVCIPFWQETNPNYFVIPNEELTDGFVKKGFNKEILLPLGIPVSSKYSKEYDKDKCKRDLNLKVNKKYVLLINGSMGFGNVLELVESFLQETQNVNYIISCGHNKKLLKEMKKRYSNNKRVIILGYTNILHKYMAASEIVLTKPGGLTTTEVATLRKPFIHTMPIPGCENYNADFFSSRKMALQSKNIKEVLANTKKLLEDENLQKELIENQEKYVNKNACEEICEMIIKDMNS